MKKYQLPREFAEKWVEALRSGEYKQWFGYYKFKGCFCALGLGLEVNDYHPSAFGIEADKVCPWNFDLKSAVMTMNDTEKKPFREIADWIESNVEFI